MGMTSHSVRTLYAQSQRHSRGSSWLFILLSPQPLHVQSGFPPPDQVTTYCSNQNKSKNSGYVCDPLADCCQVEKSSTTLPPIPLLANTMSSTSSTPPSWSLSGGEILYQFATDPSVDQHSRTCVSVKRKTVCLFCTPARSYSFLMSSWKAL